MECARALLSQPENFARIDALVLADSLYCGYDPADPDSHRLDASKMAGFRRFASEAASGRKMMLVPHSAQVPEGYASTTVTANNLVALVGASSESTDLELAPGFRLTRRASQGRFVVLGFSGSGPEDHLRHLRRLGTLWKAVAEPFPSP